MALTSIGHVAHTERDATDSSTSVTRVYIGSDGAGGYTFKSDASEATAYLKDDGSGNLTLDNDPLQDDRIPFLISTSPNTIIL